MKNGLMKRLVATSIMAGSLLMAGGDNGMVANDFAYKTGGFFGVRGSFVFSMKSSIDWTGSKYLFDSYDGNGGSFGVHLGGQEGQWRATLAYEYFDNSDDQNYDLFLTQIDYLFLPNPGAFQPYIGLDLGYLNYETVGTGNKGGAAYGGAAGVNFVVNEHVDLDLEVRYLFASQDEVDHIGSVNFSLNYFY